MNVKYEKYKDLFCKKLIEYYMSLNDVSKKQCIFYGTRMISKDKKKANDSYNNINLKLEQVIEIIDMMATLTPTEFMNIFPITKTYDGDKYECKDYLNVKKVIYSYDLNEPIGENIEEFLMSYLNIYINSFVVTYLCYINALNKYEIKMGIIDSILNLDGIDSYSKVSINKKEFMRNNKTGELTKIKKQYPSYLKVIK